MAFEGPKNGSTFVSSTENGGTQPWVNPGNAQTSDNVRAGVVLDPAIPDVSEYLKATNFGFTIPTDAVIDGIVVGVEKSRATGQNSQVGDNSAALVKGGVPSGTDHSAVPEWPTTDAYTSYGSPTDLWGLTWTPADINATGFGFVIAASPIGTQIASARVDHIRITVFYTEAGVPLYAQAWSP